MATLRSLTIQNFKGIKDPVKIEFKPITLLFGPNSAGKSTIIQALCYAREIFVNRNLNPIQTIVHGERIDLGDFQTLLHNHEKSLPMTMEFKLSLDGEGLPEYVDERLENDEEYIKAGKYLPRLDGARTVTVAIRLKWDASTFSPLVESYMVQINDEVFCEIRDTDFSTLMMENAECVGKKEEMQSILRKASIPIRHRCITGQVNLEHSLFSITSEEGTSKNVLAELAKSLLHKPERYQWTPTTSPDLLANLTDIKDAALPHWDRRISWSPWLRDRRDWDVDGEDFVNLPEFDTELWRLNAGLDEFLSRAIVGPGQLVRDWLKDLRYLGPLRAIPPRILEHGRSVYEALGSAGSSTWEELFGADEKTLSSINEWMKNPERLNSGYEVKIKRYKEFDSSQGEALDPDLVIDILQSLPERTRMLLLKTDAGLELSFRDVGTGISQVMPVVIASLVSRGHLVAIEQPELHIHPALQVNLADLFISRIQDEKALLFLLETHSEHLILRMLRRIRETSENKLPPGAPSLKPDQVSVLHIEPENGTVRVSPLRIDDNGDFIDRWPRGFFSERVKELYGE